MRHTGTDEAGARALGQQVKTAVKEAVMGQPEGEVSIPNILWNAQPPAAAPVAAAPVAEAAPTPAPTEGDAVQPEVEAQLDQPNARYYRSGATSPTDFDGLAAANAPIGVVAGLINQPMEDRIADYVHSGGHVFVDSGAFGAFMSGLRGRPASIDFDALMAQYRQLADRVAGHSQGGSLTVVAPDVVGDQTATAALQAQHAPGLNDLRRRGLDVIVPVQKGERPLGEQMIHASVTHAEAGHPAAFTFGIPFNAAAYSPEEVAAGVKQWTERFPYAADKLKIHLLGIGDQNRNYADALATIRAANPKVTISSDSNRFRAIFGTDRKGTVAVGQKKDARARNNMEDTETSDPTELTSVFYHGNLLDEFTTAELTQIVKALGTTPAALVNSTPEQRQAIVDAAGGDRVVDGLLFGIGHARRAAVESPGARKDTITEDATTGIKLEQPEEEAALQTEASSTEPHPTRLMGIPVTHVETFQDHDGVRAELYSSPTQRAVIRVIDHDSGEVVSLKSYPSLTHARQEFEDLRARITPPPLSIIEYEPDTEEAEPEPTIQGKVDTDAGTTGPAGPTEPDGTDRPMAVSETGAPQSERPAGGRPAPSDRAPGTTTDAGRPDAGPGAGDREPGPVSPDAGSVGGGRQVRADKVTDEGDEASLAPDLYTITDADAIGTGSPRERIARNFAAIRVLRTLEEEGRRATPDEQKILVKYVGWGGLSRIFEPWKNDPSDEDKDSRYWEQQHDALTTLLSREEYRLAANSTQNAHYTSPMVIHAMWQAVERLGVTSGAALEPSGGVGHFIGLSPDNLRKLTWALVEKDGITAGIAKALYPAAYTQHSPFEDATLPADHFTVAISNVPFGKIPITDAMWDGPAFMRQRIHNYFFGKALDYVAPGGLVAFVTSHGTMDAGDMQKAREYLATRADFLGAIRLPWTAFKRNANTEVVTDIIFLRRRRKGEEANHVAPWMIAETRAFPNKEGTPIDQSVNEYFLAHPEMVMGQHSSTGKQRARDQYNVVPPGESTGMQVAHWEANGAKQLADAISFLPKKVINIKPPKEALAAFTQAQAPVGSRPFELLIHEGRVAQVIDGRAEPLELTKADEARIRGLLPIRVALRDVYDKIAAEAPDADVKAAQKTLNTVYDAFVDKFGAISKAENFTPFREDPDLPLLLSLEDYDAETRDREEGIDFHDADQDRGPARHEGGHPATGADDCARRDRPDRRATHRGAARDESRGRHRRAGAGRIDSRHAQRVAAPGDLSLGECPREARGGPSRVAHDPGSRGPSWNPTVRRGRPAPHRCHPRGSPRAQDPRPPRRVVGPGRRGAAVCREHRGRRAELDRGLLSAGGQLEYRGEGQRPHLQV